MTAAELRIVAAWWLAIAGEVNALHVELGRHLVPMAHVQEALDAAEALRKIAARYLQLAELAELAR